MQEPQNKQPCAGKVFAIDFDGTISKEPGDGTFIADATKFEELEYGTIQTLLDIQTEGGKIIIFTCRSGRGLEPAIEWLKSKGFTPNGVNRSISSEVAHLDISSKVFADVYIDNRNWPKFPGWAAFRKEFLPNKPLILPQIKRTRLGL